MMQRIFDQFIKVRSVSTDTRNVVQNSIFFALKGERFNGNQFAAQALAEGASMAVVDEDLDEIDSRIVRVPDVLLALQQLSGKYRETFQIPFLGITGSNGKTTTKELIREVLKKKFRVSATVGNFNNHIGVPLTLLSIPADCEFAIIEMGANHQGEIHSYCEYAAPNYGLVTNMGKAHLEGFGGEEGVIKGKRELYDYVNLHGGKIFVNVEIEKLRDSTAGMNIIPYGFDSGGIKLKCISESPVVKYEINSAEFTGEFVTQLAGSYNLYNIASAICVGQYFGVAPIDVHEAICSYFPENNRSQLKHTNRNLIIMDAYNANPSSLEYALIGLSKQDDKEKFFVIGDMLELGDCGPLEHAHILEVAKKLGLNGITVGPIFHQLFDKNPYPSFLNNLDAKKFLEKENLKNCVILIKGSRGIRLEEVEAAL